MKFKSLFIRLMAAFVLVILIAIAIIFVVVNQTTTREFQALMFRGQMTQLDQIAYELGAYYSARGSWQGVDRFIALPNSQMMPMMGSAARNRGVMGMMSGPLTIVDVNGIVIASREGAAVGQRLPTAQTATGIPIEANGQVVGTLIAAVPGAGALDAQQQDFLLRANLSLLIAGSVAGLVALVLGFVLFYQITAPLHELATVSNKIAQGNLAARIVRPRDDEVGQVGRAFNAMADSLAQSEDARQNMIADIAHELRNPLGVIQGQLEGMIDGVFPLTTEQIALIHDETILLTRLVDDLRELALADAGQLKIARESTDLGALIVKTVDAFQVQAVEQNLTLKSEITNGLPKTNIDAQRIGQVLRNLVGNALRYTPPNGTITVQASHNGSEVTVRVHDTGQGISPENLPHVFERFWRGDKSRSRSGGGAGLGLAIAKQLIVAHGGAIGVESENGKGTTFWFTLPT
ncbi:MAG: HAMP domain-containing protein [Chloroflexi bacterium]|nr:HAMP domain-containing protein [Chloroflexota bacterium]